MDVRVAEAEVERRWAEWLLDHNRRGARVALWLVFLLHPLFAVLDVLVAPSRRVLWILLANRVLSEVITLSLFRVLRTKTFERHAVTITALYMCSVAFGISLMVAVLGGFQSPYYAGLNLVMLGCGLLYVWPREAVVVTHGAIVLSWLVPNLANATPDDAVVGATNFVFLFSTAIIASAGQIFGYRTAREQVVGQLTLERTKATLEEAHAQLMKLDRFKSQFFANVTHELKTPLAMVLSPIELMLQGDLGELNEGQKTTLRTMFRSGLKLLKLIGDLLDLSRLEESQLRLHLGEHDLVTFLRDLVVQVQPLAQRKNIKMTFATDAEAVRAWCDLERLERVFINLLSNATKFTPDGGRIEVRLGVEPDAVRVEVKDTGPGFPPDEADRIFERFYQVDMADTRKHGGTGIGLALAREIVALHGGRIEARSAPGEGATFTVVLGHERDSVPEASRASAARPEGGTTERGLVEWAAALSSRQEYKLMDIAESTERRAVPREIEDEARSHTALVVEDSPDVIRVVHLALRQHFRVVSAGDGRRGFDLALRVRPDLIVTDLMMPDVDGLELIRQLRADARLKRIPVIMLTARGDLEDRVSGIETGADAYIAKPFSPRELLSTARALVERQEAAADILLTQRMDSLEAVAGGLAHEINNPLNYVRNALARIRLDVEELAVLVADAHADPRGGARFEKLQARIQRMFGTAESGVARIGRTVDLMGRYSREGYARVAQPYDAFTAVRGVVDLVLPATGRDVKVETRFEGDGMVECIPEEWNQVVTNLVQNAIEAVPDGTGVVTVTGRREAGEVTLRVRDNGVGISPDDRDRIFTPFFTTKGPGAGQGMGLTIVWRVVHAMGGTVNVTSEPGRGTEFVVRVPPSRPSDRASLVPVAPA